MPKNQSPNIKYVCLSDLHLGEEDSLLTDVKRETGEVDPAAASPVMQALVKCLKALLGANAPGADKPTLILNGDVLELALAKTHQAAMVFQRFMQLAMPPGEELFGKIVYLPGNHDHHLWELGREAQYTAHIKGLPKKKELPEPFHTTGMFAEHKSLSLPHSELLTSLLNRVNPKTPVCIEIAYPNYAVINTIAGQERCVVFHHGHFVEPIYSLMSRLAQHLFGRPLPDTVYALEAENFAWIDFFWSALGRSAGVGEDVETIYEKMQDPQEFETLLYSVARHLAQQFDIPLVPGNALEERFLKAIFKGILDQVNKRERRQGWADGHTGHLPLSKDAYKGLNTYLEQYLSDQFQSELGRIPQHLTFVFGHTHKPFACPLRFRAGFLDRAPVYNTGGWVIEGPVPDSVYGGGVVLVDDNHEVVMLQMYKEGSADQPTVEEAIVPGDPHGKLYEHIRNVTLPKLAKHKAIWADFAVQAHRAAYVRARNLERRMHS
ncbi:MAG: hypothetical protein KAV82_09745 [Phycisphaerae bacterium]|nr:hypothetical protein [Phycisphaerae bacterium]